MVLAITEILAELQFNWLIKQFKLFLDFRKALNAVNHVLMIEKLEIYAARSHFELVFLETIRNCDHQLCIVRLQCN